MAKTANKDNNITKVKPMNNLPDFMKDEEVTGLDMVKNYIKPPRIKIVQKQSSADLLSLFGAGDVILSPQNVMVVEMVRDGKGRPLDDDVTSFSFVPLFFYPEWVTWNPLELKGKESSIRYRTTDPSDPVVKKAQTKELREELIPDGNGMKMKHCEHLNFVILIQGDTEHSETPCILSFSRSAWTAGSKFCSLLSMRKAPIYGCVFDAVVISKKNDLGDWYGLDIVNPAGSPWVEKEYFEAYKILHQEFEEYHKESRLRPDIESDESDSPSDDM